MAIGPILAALGNLAQTAGPAVKEIADKGENAEKSTSQQQFTTPILTPEGQQAQQFATQDIGSYVGGINSGAQQAAAAKQASFSPAAQAQTQYIQNQADQIQQYQQNIKDANTAATNDVASVRSNVENLSNFAKIDPQAALSRLFSSDITPEQEAQINSASQPTGNEQYQLNSAPNGLIGSPESDAKMAIANQINYNAEDRANTLQNQLQSQNDSRALGNKLLAGIGLVLSGIGSGLTGQPNLAMEMLQKTIDRSIDAQKQTFANKLQQAQEKAGLPKTDLSRIQTNAIAQNIAGGTIQSLVGAISQQAGTSYAGAGAQGEATMIAAGAHQQASQFETNLSQILAGKYQSETQTARSLYGNILQNTGYSQAQELNMNPAQYGGIAAPSKSLSQSAPRGNPEDTLVSKDAFFQAPPQGVNRDAAAANMFNPPPAQQSRADFLKESSKKKTLNKDDLSNFYGK